ncbi:MAG: sensor histidine kinase [Bacteroidota bacterium]
MISLILIGVIFTSFIRTVHFLRKEKRITREKMDFVKNLIHEYKTPIATISMASDILIKEQREAKNTKLMRYLSIIRDENTRLRQLVEKLMGMAVIDRAELTLSQEQVDLHHLIRRATEILSLQLEQARAKVEMNLMAEKSMIYADPVHIVHVLTNILDNAMKYSDLDPLIFISTDNDSKNKIHMEICDNGMGIPPEQQKQIFKQFYRGSQHVKQGKSGFGLGLYYVKTMIEQHDGTIHIQSVPEQGTCFSVYLPIIN